MKKEINVVSCDNIGSFEREVNVYLASGWLIESTASGRVDTEHSFYEYFTAILYLETKGETDGAEKLYTREELEEERMGHFMFGAIVGAVATIVGLFLISGNLL